MGPSQVGRWQVLQMVEWKAGVEDDTFMERERLDDTKMVLHVVGVRSRPPGMHERARRGRRRNGPSPRLVLDCRHHAKLYPRQEARRVYDASVGLRLLGFDTVMVSILRVVSATESMSVFHLFLAGPVVFGSSVLRFRHVGVEVSALVKDAADLALFLSHFFVVDGVFRPTHRSSWSQNHTDHFGLFPFRLLRRSHGSWRLRFHHARHVNATHVLMLSHVSFCCSRTRTKLPSTRTSTVELQARALPVPRQTLHFPIDDSTKSSPKICRTWNEERRRRLRHVRCARDAPSRRDVVFVFHPGFRLF